MATCTPAPSWPLVRARACPRWWRARILCCDVPGVGSADAGAGCSCPSGLRTGLMCARQPARPDSAAEETTYVIDPEFAYYGPMAFDVGKILANLLLAFFACDGHASGGLPRP